MSFSKCLYILQCQNIQTSSYYYLYIGKMMLMWLYFFLNGWAKLFDITISFGCGNTWQWFSGKEKYLILHIFCTFTHLNIFIYRHKGKHIYGIHIQIAIPNPISILLFTPFTYLPFFYLLPTSPLSALCYSPYICLKMNVFFIYSILLSLYLLPSPSSALP